MSDYETWKRWNRASPWIGAVGAPLYAASQRAFGSTGADAWLFRALPTEALFGLHPAVGYLGFVLLGFATGYALRAFEDRYIWTDEG